MPNTSLVPLAAPLEGEQPIGAPWLLSSLIHGQPGGRGEEAALASPLGDALIQKVNLLAPAELLALSQPAQSPASIDRSEVLAFSTRLHAQAQALSTPLLRAMQLETGYLWRDCREMLDGTLQFMREFPQSISHTPEAPEVEQRLRYEIGGQRRSIGLARRPWGTVAVVLPQNAFLFVACTALLNGLAAGNRVILRAPLQSGRSAALLALAIRRASTCSPANGNAHEAGQAVASAISLVNVRARDFIRSLCKSPSPLLIHYMGGSNRAAPLLAEAFEAGKAAIVDGSGNAWVWVDKSAGVSEAVEILTAGALRYNGQTCTSINGALIHPDIYEEVRRQLAQRWQELSFGSPAHSNQDAADTVDAVDVGPLFDEAQAQWCEQQLAQSGGRVLCGGSRAGNLLAPTLIESPRPDSGLVREGLFGPGLWLSPATAEEFALLWRSNRYPLCAGVLSEEDCRWAADLPNLARLVLNGDPSIEHIHEPWGGYPSSGQNPVSGWLEKYQRVAQIDAPLDAGPARRASSLA